MDESPAFQDQLQDNFCFGCGPENPDGLQIKSYWDGERESVCRYRPKPHQAAGPRQFLNGGIIATIIDCHCVCTAAAAALRRGAGPASELWYVTGTLNIRYLKPTPLAEPADLRARIVEEGERKTVLRCTLSSAGQVRAEAEVVALRVPSSWRHGP